MKEKQLRTYDFEGVAWGLFFVWWGIPASPPCPMDPARSGSV